MKEMFFERIYLVWLVYAFLTNWIPIIWYANDRIKGKTISENESLNFLKILTLATGHCTVVLQIGTLYYDNKDAVFYMMNFTGITVILLMVTMLFSVAINLAKDEETNKTE